MGSSRTRPASTLMTPYAILIRGINVGGKNIVSMAGLKTCLEKLGFTDVSTYIASGNVFLRSGKTAAETKALVEKALPGNFKLHDPFVKVLVLSRKQLQAVMEHKPPGFGEKPDTYHSDAVFLMDIKPAEATKVFSPREGVDQVWPGKGVIYSQRLSAQRTKSRLNRIVGTDAYKSMTIRNWNTTTKLLELLTAMESK
jgi:uncharacterized protein (DUF1697 family)